MNRREFLKYSALWTGAASAVTSGGCVTLSKPLKPAGLHVFPGESLLLTNANLIDVERGRVVPASHVLIRDKVVVEVSNGSAVPPHNKSIDLGGKYLMPGLINNHCHITLPGAAGLSLTFLLALKRQAERNAEECVKHGVTTVRDMLAPHGSLNEMRAAIARGDLVGPRILMGSAIQVEKGYMSVFRALGGAKTIKIVHTPAEARDAVNRCIDEGADFIKTFLQYTELWIPPSPLPVLTDEELRAVVEEADAHGHVVAVHHTSLAGFRRSLAAGVPSFEHMPIDAGIPGKDVEEFVKTGRGIIPTATVGWALSYRRNGDPLSGSPEVGEIIEDRQKRLASILDEFCEEEVKRLCLKYFALFSRPEYFDRRHLMITPEPKIFNATAVVGGKNLLALHRAGALMGAGNDGGIPFVFPGMMALELLLLQRLGIAPMEALKMATINNARIMRRADKIGSIARGKLADLVVLSANPASDAAHLSSIEMVFIEGRLRYSTDTA